VKSRTAPVITNGALRASPVAGGLELRGWVAPVGAGVMDGFRVLVDHRDRTGLAHEVRPRAAAARRSQVGAAKNAPRGVHVFVPLRAARRSGSRGHLVTLVPSFGDRQGLPLFAIAGHRIPLPSRRDRAAVVGPFVPIGCRWLSALSALGHLAPNGRVLDVGCGPGRMAYCLAHYLDSSGRYEGLDVVHRHVRRLRATVTRRFPNVRFRCVDLRNGLYNPRGDAAATRFRFPYAPKSFDAVVAFSVFQHVGPEVVRHYLREIGTVLRPGGRCVFSCFLVARPSDRTADSLDFVHRVPGGWTADAGLPEVGFAYGERTLRRWLAESGLALRVRLGGRWRRPSGFSYQDVVVAERT
jgi:SAM-dependent methyltransferase